MKETERKDNGKVSGSCALCFKHQYTNVQAFGVKKHLLECRYSSKEVKEYCRAKHALPSQLPQPAAGLSGRQAAAASEQLVMDSFVHRPLTDAEQDTMQSLQARMFYMCGIPFAVADSSSALLCSCSTEWTKMPARIARSSMGHANEGTYGLP